MILVSGSTGHVGSELTQQLVSAGKPVRVLVRHLHHSGMPGGVESVAGDLNDPASLSTALHGVDAMFLLGGFRDMPGILGEIRSAGVQHVALLSSRSVLIGDPSNAIVKMWMTAESALHEGGVPWTIIRSSGFMSNSLEWVPQVRAGDIVRAPFSAVPIAAIDPSDIAAVAASVLTSGQHVSEHLTITGPAPILPSDRVRVLAATLGRPLVFEPQSDAAARKEMSASMPAPVVEAMFRFFAEGQFDDSQVLDTVREITGRAPRDFMTWASQHAHEFL